MAKSSRGGKYTTTTSLSIPNQTPVTKDSDMKMSKMTIIKVDSKGNEYNYGKGYKDPYEVIPKNYKFNGLFYEASNTKTIYIIKEL